MLASEVHVEIELTGPFAFLLANAVQMLSVVDWNGVWMHFYIDSSSLMMVPHESFLFNLFQADRRREVLSRREEALQIVQH